jgi:hypothetical protein
VTERLGGASSDRQRSLNGFAVVRILEPRAAGHRLWFVRLLGDAAPGRCILVTTGDGLASVEFDRHLRASGVATEVVECPARRLGGWFAEALARTRPDADCPVVVPDAEAALLPLLFTQVRIPAVTIVLMRMHRGDGPRGAAVYAGKLLLAGALKVRWRGRLRVLALLPAGATDRLALRLAGIGVVHDPVRFRPVTMDAASSRHHLGLPVGERIFAVLGPLSGRKCVLELIEAWSGGGIPGLLLLAGAAPPGIAEAVRRAGPPGRSRIVLRDRYVDDEEFDTYLAATDVAVLLYRNRGASGVLGKALAADCDVLTSANTPPIHPGRGGRRVVRMNELTVDGIRATLLAWPGRRERRPLRVDDTADFARTLLGGAE